MGGERLNKIKWFFTSKYKRLLHNISVAKENKMEFVLPNGIIVDFREDKWQRVYRNSFGHDRNVIEKKGNYYLITRHFPTGNKKMELIKCDGNRLYLPEFTIAIMEVNASIYSD